MNYKHFLVLALAITCTFAATCPCSEGQCNDSNICAKCNDETMTPSSNCNCATALFFDGASCQPCNNLCETCSSADTCDSCKTGKGLALHLEEKTCKCMDDYIENTGSDDPATKCDECYIYGNQCLASCPDGTEANDDVMICEIGKAEDVENDDQTHIIIVAVIIIIVQLLLSIALYNYLFSKLKEAFTKDQNAVHELTAEERAYLGNQGAVDKNLALGGEDDIKSNVDKEAQGSEVIE